MSTVTINTLSDFTTPPPVPVSSPLVAFHGSAELKAFYIGRVNAHREADTLVRGTGWDNGRGCAVGCTLHCYEHSQYPGLIGIPEHLAYLQDAIFEGLPKDEAMEFPTQFMEAIPVGAVLSLVWWQFADRLLNRAFARIDDTEVISACAHARELVRRASVGDIAPGEEWEGAALAARAASAAREAASAAWEAASAAWAARDAAWAAREAAWATGPAEYQAQRDDLIELLRTASVLGEMAQ